jgi:hypothetical protein
LSAGKGGTPNGYLRATRAEVAAWDDQPSIKLTLTGMPPIQDGGLRLETPLDYPVILPHVFTSAGFEEALAVMLAMAQNNPRRRQLPLVLDETLALVLHPRGPARAADLVPQADGTTDLIINVHRALAAAALSLPEWIHSLRVIEAWQRRRSIIPIEVGQLEREVSEAIAAANGHLREALNTVLANMALASFNIMLRVPPSEN